jgi:hypothetical protein
MYTSPVDYKVLPAEVVMSMDMARLKFSVQKDGTMLITTAISTVLQWEDQKLHESECNAALPDVLGLSQSETSSSYYRDLLESATTEQLHLTRLVLEHNVALWPSGIDHSTFDMPRGVPWQVPGVQRSGGADILGKNASTTAVCDYCVLYTETIHAALPLAFDFKLFPFDKHDINMTFTLDGSAGSSSSSSLLFGCATVADNLRQAELLPMDNSWSLGGIWYEESAAMCHIRIEVHRNWLVFFIKNILVIVIIIEGVLLALRLNPLVPPLLGGRFSSQVRATLSLQRINPTSQSGTGPASSPRAPTPAAHTCDIRKDPLSHTPHRAALCGRSSEWSSLRIGPTSILKSTWATLLNFCGSIGFTFFTLSHA